LSRALLVLLAAWLAAPAPRAWGADNSGKKGRPFAKASIAFAAPADLSQQPDGALTIRLVVKGYPIGVLKPGGPVPHAHLIVDNEPALEISDAKATWVLGGLSPGPHLLRAVLCRPWHEVVKTPKAFAMVRFWIGPRLPGKAGKAAESVIWPHPRKPILTYVLPLARPSEQLVLARLDDSGDPPQVRASDPALAHRATRPVLDFYISNAKLGRRGEKIRIVLDRRELPLITEWKPLLLRRARIGMHRISIDLLSRRGVKVSNVVNRTDRVFSTHLSR
jgi:hypothetical protein